MNEEENELRRCGKCGHSKPLAEFAWRRRKRLQRDSLCRACRSEYGKEHYRRNRQRYIDQAAELKRKNRRERTIYLIEFFKANPCVDCGEADPVVLEFDHVGAKQFEVTKLFAERSWEKILEEMKVCEVVCANCHRRRTAERRRSLRYVLTRERLADT